MLGTIGMRLDALCRHHGSQMTANRCGDQRSLRALYWKRARWAAKRRLEDCGYGRRPEWQTPEYLDADYDFDRAEAEHRRIIASMWKDRALERHGPTFDLTKSRERQPVQARVLEGV